MDFRRRYFREGFVRFRAPEVESVVASEIEILEEVLDAVVVLLVGASAVLC